MFHEPLVRSAAVESPTLGPERRVHDSVSKRKRMCDNAQNAEATFMRRSLVCLIAWLPLAALALGIAAVVYLHVRYSPRCSIVTRDPVLHVADDGEWLLTEMPEAIRVWNARTGETKADYLTGIRNRGLSHDRELLLGVDKDTLHLVDWRKDKNRTVVIGEPVDSFSLRDPWCVVTLINGEQLLIDLRDEQIARRFPKDVGLRWREDDRLLLQDREGIHLWNLTDRRIEATLLVGDEKLSEWSQPRLGRWVVTWTVRGTLVERFDVWDFKTKSKRPRLEGNPGHPAFSPDGERIAYLIRDHEKQTSELVVLETASGKTLKRGVRYGLDVGGFSLDGRLVVLGENPDVPGTVVVDAETGKLIHEDTIRSSFLYRKNLLVPRGGPGAIRDAKTGEALLQISNLEWSYYPENERLIVLGRTSALTNQSWRWLAKLLPNVLGEGQLVQIYETDNLREVYRVRFPSKRVSDWTISKDGSVFVTQFDDPADDEPSRIDVWDMNPRRAQVCAGLGGIGAVLPVIAFRAWRRRRKVAGKS
jgi:hypothetical protein